MTPEDTAALNHKSATSTRRRLEDERSKALTPFVTKAADAFNKMGLGDVPSRRTGESDATYVANVLDIALSSVAALPSTPARWRGFDPTTVKDPAALQAMAGPLLNEAVTAMTASGPGTGDTRVIEMQDEAGRTIRKFAGDVDCWAPFRTGVRRIEKWNPQGLGRGKHAIGAIVPVAVTMSDGSTRDA